MWYLHVRNEREFPVLKYSVLSLVQAGRHMTIPMMEPAHDTSLCAPQSLINQLAFT